MTYEELKQKYWDDTLGTLSKKIQDDFSTTLTAWYCTTDFDTVGRITGINPMDGNEANGSCDKMVDDARRIWNAMELSQKFDHFIEECDSAEELAKFIN